jgi:hypothetical protein
MVICRQDLLKKMQRNLVIPLATPKPEGGAIEVKDAIHEEDNGDQDEVSTSCHLTMHLPSLTLIPYRRTSWIINLVNLIASAKAYMLIR